MKESLHESQRPLHRVYGDMKQVSPSRRNAHSTLRHLRVPGTPSSKKNINALPPPIVLDIAPPLVASPASSCTPLGRVVMFEHSALAPEPTFMSDSSDPIGLVAPRLASPFPHTHTWFCVALTFGSGALFVRHCHLVYIELRCVADPSVFAYLSSPIGTTPSIVSFPSTPFGQLQCYSHPWN
ncbi:hypothetical protein CRENBAI_022349 [Crenichthys baileyi]|uniref:Uncharacterized protein n=1 Tax=Crenichthys baileyi TaxID=28760 RepID=A0AAV9RM06_9TELE